MIGIIYIIKTNLYIGSHPKDGFFQCQSIDNLDKEVLWISNIKDTLSYEHIKKENFFNISFKNILYYYNANHLAADEQFEFLISFYSTFISIFKEEYTFFNLKAKDFFKYNNFLQILIKSDIRKYVSSVEIPMDVKNSFKKEVMFSKFESKDYFLSFFSKADFIQSVFDLSIPFGQYERTAINPLSTIKDPLRLMETLPKEKSYLFKCSILEISEELKQFFPEKKGEVWFSDLEIMKLKQYLQLECSEIITFSERRRLREIMRTRFKTRYNNFAFEIFVKNIIFSLKQNNIDTLNLWLDSYEKIYFIDGSISLIRNGISVGYSAGSELVITSKSLSDISILEDNSLIYPVKLLQYIVNN